MVLNYSNSVDCAAVICQGPKAQVCYSVSKLMKLARRMESCDIRDGTVNI